MGYFLFALGGAVGGFVLAIGLIAHEMGGYPSFSDIIMED